MTDTTIRVRKFIAGAMALLMATMPVAPVALAAPTVLTDLPIAAKVAAKPNLLYTLDDSGSMSLAYIPDSVITGPGQSAPNNQGPGYCRTTPSNTFPLAAGSIPASPTTGCGTSMTFGRDLPMLAAEFNRLYYNPDVNYDPPIDGLGNQATFTNPDGVPGITAYKFMTSAKTAAWTAVKVDPYLSASTANLAATVSVPVYCNTDWPKDNPVTVLSVGNANGEYSPTAGADCRINGTRYDALSGAPAVTDDYNYPYNWSTVGTPNTKYFYRNGGNRQIWCRTDKPGWPTTITPTGCTTVCTTITPPVAQTCFYQSDQTTTGAPYTYTPAGCDTNPAYQWTWATGGCVGTIGVECLACNRTGTTVTSGKNGRCRLATSTAPGSGGSNATCNCAGAGCTLPACPMYDPPDTGCTTTCTGSSTTPNGSAQCNTTYGTTTGATGGSTLLMDANGAGITCRRNNFTGAYVSTQVTFPETFVADPSKYNKVVNDSSCGSVASTVNIPRHYYSIASVQFCNAKILTANDPWKGFGTGTCQTKNDLNTKNNAQYGKFTRTNLINDGRTFPYTDQFTGVTSSRSFLQEMANYANWYAYYRTRILAAKTTTSIAFNIVDNKWRAGFHVMNAVATNWLDSGDFVSGSGLQRESWYNKLFAVPITAGQKTPTLDALIRIGQLVENGAGAVGGLPAHTDPIPTVAGNPVTCTANYHILFTDGFTDQTTLPTVAGEVDGGNVPARGASIGGKPALPADPGASAPTRSLSGLNALIGSSWPRPFRDAATPTANSLADISLYYWMRDLRPAMTDNVPSSDGRASKDLDWKKDPGWWQHVNFSALSYGADGLLDAANRPAVEAAIAGGASWFTAPNFPAPPNNSPWPATNVRATTADDLWHAAVNGRGKFAFAQTPLEVAYGLGSIISGIGNNSVARVGATFASRNLGPTNDFIYVATVEPGWSGDLKKVTIDTLTAVQGATRWSAAVKLDALLATPAPGTSPVVETDNAWFLDRRIVTRNVDAGTFTVVPFRYADLNTGTNTQLNTLAANATRQQKVIAYLRGGSTFGPGPTPQVLEGTAIGQFRERTGKLGNISDSKPVIVGPANKPFTDADDPGYTTYTAAHSSRALRVFVGANDGMFHVFNGENDTGPNTGGTEMFAYIPSAVFTNAFDEGGIARKGIQALTYQDGGAPIFKHHFYVNASPRTQDVDFGFTGGSVPGSTDWRTIVVSGLGKGGNTYFAIDATDTSVANESQAAAKVLWEFALPNSQFSFGNPVIAKTRAYGWVVVVASGYNNTGDGKGHLYFINAKTGALLRTLNTTAADSGSVANPSGLTKISGYVKDDANQVLEQIYGGDLNGRLWRWDVADIDPTTWQAKTVHLATLTDPSSAPQPVTTAPEIEIDLNNGVDRFVFVGTGRLLDAEDLTTPSPEQIQSMYAIRDGTLDTPMTTGLPVDGRTGLAAASGIAGVGGPAPNGWRQDLPSGQRIVVDPVAEFNVVLYSGTVLQPDPCLTSLPAYVYGRDYVSGESVVFTGGAQQPYFYTAEGAVGLDMVALYDPSQSFPVIAGIASGGDASGGIRPISIKPKSFGGGHRLSWRILGD
jgi:type IV pilus assembly protein PilY1